MKVFFSLIIASFLATSVFAADDFGVRFCDGNSKTISEEQFLECDKLTLKSDVWEIKYFTIGVSVGGDYKSLKIIGNSLEGKFPKSLSAGDKIFLEKIVLVNDNGEEKKMPNQVFTITE